MWTTFLAYMKQLDVEKKRDAELLLEKDDTSAEITTSQLKTDLIGQKTLL